MLIISTLCYSHFIFYLSADNYANSSKSASIHPGHHFSYINTFAQTSLKISKLFKFFLLLKKESEISSSLVQEWLFRLLLSFPLLSPSTKRFVYTSSVISYCNNIKKYKKTRSDSPSSKRLSSVILKNIKLRNIKRTLPDNPSGKYLSSVVSCY